MTNRFNLGKQENFATERIYLETRRNEQFTEQQKAIMEKKRVMDNAAYKRELKTSSKMSGVDCEQL